MVKGPIRKTGFTNTTAESYLIDAGAVFANLEYAAQGGWTGELIGATSGGNSFVVEEEFREIEVDGPKSRYVGERVKTSSNASITTNVKEITPETLRMAINGVVRSAEPSEAPTGYQVVEGKVRVEAGDYLDNIGLVGTLNGTNEPVIIILDNALCTSGLELALEDDNEAVIAMTFEAHVSAEQIFDDVLPYRIYYPQPTA